MAVIRLDSSIYMHKEITYFISAESSGLNFLEFIGMLT